MLGFFGGGDRGRPATDGRRRRRGYKGAASGARCAATDAALIKEEQDQNELSNLLNDMVFELSEKVNSSGKFYGSVNQSMISEKIETDTERSLDRRFFHIENTIEEPGIYTVGILSLIHI